jgi:hypothetical protein
MIRRKALVPMFVAALAVIAGVSHAAPAQKPRGEVAVKGEQKIEKRGKKPLGLLLVRHLDMAVAIDAQSKSLEAQSGAVSARYATTRSLTPGSPYVGGTQRNAVGGNLRNYNETEVEAGLPLWLPGQRDAMEATVSSGVVEIEARIAQRRLDVAGQLRDAWWRAQGGMILDVGGGTNGFERAVRRRAPGERGILHPRNFFRALRLREFCLGGEQFVFREQRVGLRRIAQFDPPRHIRTDLAGRRDADSRDIGFARRALRTPPCVAQLPRDVQPALRDALFDLDDAARNRRLHRVALAR